MEKTPAKMIQEGERDTLIKVLRNARNEAGFSQRGLSDHLNRSHSYIGKIEDGERDIKVMEFIEVARALRIDPVKLFARIFD